MVFTSNLVKGLRGGVGIVCLFRFDVEKRLLLFEHVDAYVPEQRTLKLIAHAIGINRFFVEGTLEGQTAKHVHHDEPVGYLLVNAGSFYGKGAQPKRFQGFSVMGHAVRNHLIKLRVGAQRDGDSMLAIKIN